MRLLMGVSKNRHGTYYAVKKVPARLEHAVAQVLGGAKARQSWLKRSLGTKVLSEANVRAKLVLAHFDQIIAQAEAQLKARPLLTSLSAIEIKRIADYFYAHELEADQELREDSRGSDPLYASVHKQLAEADVAFAAQHDLKSLTLDTGRGLSPRMMRKIETDTADMLAVAEDALARGDCTTIRYEVDALLEAFQINLDRSCADYRKLARAVLTAHVRQLRAVLARQKGEPVETPPLVLPSDTDASGGTVGETLRGAFDGWKRQRERSAATQVEYERAVKLFAELHGDLPVAHLKRNHGRQFREALQEVPARRPSKLLNASLPQLVQWGHEHPDVPKVTAGTVNKHLTAVQAIANWALDNGMIPDDVQWADPFRRMRLGEEEAVRGGAPFELADLKLIFCSSVFTKGERPKGGRGEAAFWFPFLALFIGARLNELASLKVADVAHNDVIGAQCILIKADKRSGKRIKTEQSERFIPVHPQLIAAGFLEYVSKRRTDCGGNAWLFSDVAPGTNGKAAFSKWFGRYIGTQGITDSSKVFHSFRHSFVDALRLASVPTEIIIALVGHTDTTMTGRYGAKDKATRFRHRLAEAIASMTYTGLDLSHLTRHQTSQYEARARP